MKTLKLISYFLLFCTLPLHAYTERDLLQKTADKEKLREYLIPDRRWVPYPRYHEREKWDEFLKDYKTGFITQGEKYLSYEWKVVKATDYIEFQRSGDRNSMQAPYEANIKAINTLLLAELAEGEGRFIDQLINGVYLCCEMTSWAASAHLVVQKSRKSLPDYKEHIIDLLSGDLSSLLSWTWYFLHEEFDKVNPVIAERLKKELKERTMDPYMQSSHFWWQALNYKPGMLVNNWNAWCNFNVLQTFLLMEDDMDKLAAAIHRTMESIDKFINYTHSDGACEEGPAYWGHAAGKLFDYLSLLSEATGGKISVFDQPIIKNMGEYIARSYVGEGWVVNFADAPAKGGGDAYLIYRFGKTVNSRVMETYAGNLYQKNKESIVAGRDIFRTFQNLLYADKIKQAPSGLEHPPYTWYPETEFCYMTNKNGFFLAAKGGFNNESHNHNDVGSFSLYLNNTPVFIDAGVGTYTRQTFSSERYSLWYMQSNYHNLPMINGYPQSFGSKYKATHTTFDPKRKIFKTDISAAYPKEANIKKWVRSYSLQNNGVTIEENFELIEAIAPNRINFLSHGKIDITTPGKILVETGEQKVMLSYNKNKFTVVVEPIQLEDRRLSSVWGDVIYRISLIANDLSLKDTYTFKIESFK